MAENRGMINNILVGEAECYEFDGGSNISDHNLHRYMFDIDISLSPSELRWLSFFGSEKNSLRCFSHCFFFFSFEFQTKYQLLL